MDAGLPKCSEQWMHLFCAGLVGPHSFNYYLLHLMCTSWSFDTVTHQNMFVCFYFCQKESIWVSSFAWACEFFCFGPMVFGFKHDLTVISIAASVGYLYYLSQQAWYIL